MEFIYDVLRRSVRSYPISSHFILSYHILPHLIPSRLEQGKVRCGILVRGMIPSLRLLRFTSLRFNWLQDFPTDRFGEILRVAYEVPAVTEDSDGSGKR